MKMTEDELLGHVEREEANCIVHFTSLLQEQRRKAMAYYYGQPYGNEIEGRSQVVTTEVKDAVEGILPSLMAIFASATEIVRCEPNKPGDETGARQASDYLQYVFWEKNPGFLILYCLFKDALLQKNGYAKVYWEDYEDNGQETYEGLNDMEFQSLMADPELELKEHTDTPDPQAAQQMTQAGMLPGVHAPVPMLHDAVFRRSRKYGKTCIEPCPPEEILISREAPNDINKARFVEHRTLRTLSDIREMGYEVDDGLADYAPNADFNLERVERLKYDDALAYRQDNDLSDPANRRVWFCEAYLKVDFNGDGLAELRKVTKVGKTILDNTELDSLPVIGGTAILMPHKHYGLSLYDLINDIQLQKSMVLRQLFDNAYVANNGRMQVLDNMVNMGDLLTARPNGIVRVKTMGAVQRIDNPLLGAPFYNLLEYLDKVKTNRIGATDFPNAVDPDAINAKATFVDHYKQAALERITLMARILAETVVKPLFLKILELEGKHQQKSLMVRLRGKFVEIDPREWENKFTLNVTVGLGSGAQPTQLSGAMAILQAQQQMMMGGLTNVVTAHNVYAAANELAKSQFPKTADLFFTDPATVPPPQPKPDVNLLKVQLAAQKASMGNKQKYDKMMLDYQLALKAMGIDVLIHATGQAHEAAMQSRDHLNEQHKDTLGHAVDLTMHNQDLLANQQLASQQPPQLPQ